MLTLQHLGNWLVPILTGFLPTPTMCKAMVSMPRKLRRTIHFEGRFLDCIVQRNGDVWFTDYLPLSPFHQAWSMLSAAPYSNRRHRLFSKLNSRLYKRSYWPYRLWSGAQPATYYQIRERRLYAFDLKGGILSKREAAHVSGTGMGAVCADVCAILVYCNGNRPWSGYCRFSRKSTSLGADTSYH